MTGLISTHPSQSAVRLVVGATLLLLVQSALLLLLPTLAPTARTLILVLSSIATLGFGLALIGLPEPSPRRWRIRSER